MVRFLGFLHKFLLNAECILWEMRGLFVVSWDKALLVNILSIQQKKFMGNRIIPNLLEVIWDCCCQHRNIYNTESNSSLTVITIILLLCSDYIFKPKIVLKRKIRDLRRQTYLIVCDTTVHMLKYGCKFVDVESHLN